MVFLFADDLRAIMFHIGIATQAPPLPEHGELSELGIDFIERCLTLDAKERPTATDLLYHPWLAPMLQQFVRSFIITGKVLLLTRPADRTCSKYRRILTRRTECNVYFGRSSRCNSLCGSNRRYRQTILFLYSG